MLEFSTRNYVLIRQYLGLHSENFRREWKYSVKIVKMISKLTLRSQTDQF